MLGNAGEQSVLGHEALYATGCKAMVITAQIDFFCAAVANKEWFCRIGTLSNVAFDPVGGSFANKNGAILLAFTAYHEFSPLKVNVVTIEVGEFADTQPAAKQKF